MPNKYKLLVSIILVGLIVLARLLPHLPNVAPVAAAGLVAGAYLGRRWALGVVLGGMLLSDFFVGFYHLTVMLSVYISFAVIAWLAGYLKKYKTPTIVLTYSLGASFIFYLVTNFAVWATAIWYPKNLAGLVLAYEMGLPFLRYTLVGDLFYTVVLFVSFELVLSFFPMLLKQKKLEKIY
jgi:hypothetical protein